MHAITVFNRVLCYSVKVCPGLFLSKDGYLSRLYHIRMFCRFIEAPASLLERNTTLTAKKNTNIMRHTDSIQCSRTIPTRNTTVTIVNKVSRIFFSVKRKLNIFEQHFLARIAKLDCISSVFLGPFTNPDKTKQKAN